MGRKRKREKTVPSLLKLAMACIAHNRERLLTLDGIPPNIVYDLFRLCFEREQSRTICEPLSSEEARTMLEDMKPFLAETSQLKKLNLSFHLPTDFLGGSIGRELYGTLGRKGDLTSLSLPPGSSVDVMAAHLCLGNIELHHLDISRCRISDDRVLEMTPLPMLALSFMPANKQTVALRWGCSLTHLRICKVTMLPSEALCRATPHLTNLLLLDLSGCTTTGLRSSVVIAITEQCLALETLILKNCWRVEDQAIISISNNLRQLRCLNLDGLTNLSDFAVSTLSRLSYLEFLSIGRPPWLAEHQHRVTDVSVSRIVKGCGNLSKINVPGINLRPETIALAMEKSVELLGQE